MATFGDRLQRLMNENNVKQKDLAEKLNVKRGSVSNWITNRRCPDAETIVNIADYFNVTVDSLLKDTDNKDLIKIKEDLDEMKSLYDNYLELSEDNKILIDSMIETMLKNQKSK